MARTKDKRELLIAVGERLFAQRGYRGVNVKDITEEAGLGTASFYTYFSGKRSLYEWIVDHLERETAAEMERHVESFQSPLNKLKALLRFAFQDFPKTEILRGILAGDRKFGAAGVQTGAFLFSRMEAVIGKVLAEGTRKGNFRTDVFRGPTRMLMTILRAILASGRMDGSADLAADVSLLVERGMKRWLHLRIRDERRDRRAGRLS